MVDSIQLMAMLGAHQSREDNSGTTFTTPTLIKDLMDLQKVKLEKHIRNRNDADVIYQNAKQAINTFKVDISSAIDEANNTLEVLTEVSFNAEYTKFKKDYKKSLRSKIII